MMMDDPPFEPDRALFARWHAARDAAAPAPALPDAVTLAAYAEGRLDDAAAEAVEAALAADPDLLETLLALRAPPQPEAAAAVIRSAQALVRAEPVVVPFPVRKPGAARPVKAWLAWGAVAASLLLVSVAGFDMGLATGHDVSATSAGDDSPSDLLDLSGLTGDDIG